MAQEFLSSLNKKMTSVNDNLPMSSMLLIGPQYPNRSFSQALLIIMDIAKALYTLMKKE